jgi:hypothetical protein
MKNRIKALIAAIGFVFISAGAALTLALPTFASTPAAPAAKSCPTTAFLTFPAWYNGMTNADCSLKSPNDYNTAPVGQPSNGLSVFIWHIVLNVIDIVLQLVGYISVIFIMIGGFTFLTSSGEAANIAKAKNTITNAIIGLVISIASVAIINLIVGIIK